MCVATLYLDLRRREGVPNPLVPRARRCSGELAAPAAECAERGTAGALRGDGRLRWIGIVALARKPLVALWRYLETGQLPTGAVLKPNA